MSYFHCGNGYPDRCNGYKGPLDTYACLNARHHKLGRGVDAPTSENARIVRGLRAARPELVEDDQ